MVVDVGPVGAGAVATAPGEVGAADGACELPVGLGGGEPVGLAVALGLLGRRGPIGFPALSSGTGWVSGGSGLLSPAVGGSATSRLPVACARAPRSWASAGSTM